MSTPFPDLLASHIPTAEVAAVEQHRNVVAIALASALVSGRADDSLPTDLAAIKAAAVAGEALPAACEPYRSKLAAFNVEAFLQVGQ